MNKNVKRLLSLALCLVLVLSVLPLAALAADTGTRRVYCQAPNGWTNCNAYWWGSAVENPGWPGIAMSADEDGIWYIDIPVDTPYIIFNNGSGSQSADLTVPTDDKVMYVYSNKTWDVYGKQEVEECYYVAGTFNEWYCDAEGYRMTHNGDGIYSLDISLTTGRHFLKITDGTWENCWGDIVTGADYEVEVVTDGTITVTFDSTEGLITVTGDCLGEIVPDSLEINTIHAAGASGLLGAEWDPTENEMAGENGIYTITLTDIAAGTYEFKFVANGNWDINWGADAQMESDVEYDAWIIGGNCIVTVAENGSDVTLVLDLSAMDAVTGEGAKCSVSVSVPGAATTPVEIVEAAYALANGESLEGSYTLTGEITNIDTPYSAAYKNITVTIEVPGCENMPIQCFRLIGDGIDTLAIGDVITVTGTLMNYKGTIEFVAKCTLDAVVKGDNEASVPPEDPIEIVEAAYALEVGASLPYNCTLTGELVSIDTAYDASFNNITVTMAVAGAEDKPIVCYRLKGDGVATLAEGDTITVTGQIKNYIGTIEFVSGCTLDAVVKGDTVIPDAGVTVSGRITSMSALGTVTIMLSDDTGACSVTTEDGTYTIEGVAAGTYTLTVSAEGFVTRIYEVTVGTEDVTQDGKLCIKGDVTGDGKLNIMDVSWIYSHVKGTAVLDDYACAVADVIRDGKVDIGDTAVVYARIKGRLTTL